MKDLIPPPNGTQPTPPQAPEQPPKNFTFQIALHNGQVIPGGVKDINYFAAITQLMTFLARNPFLPVKEIHLVEESGVLIAAPFGKLPRG